MDRYICVTCGTEYPEPASGQPPERCPICEDERQYVGCNGQQWTTLAALRGKHRNRFDELEPGVTAIRTEPGFAINQHAILIESPGGNVLWDCIALLDEPTIEWVRGRGGVRAIAISHPHYYTTMVEWSHACGGAPIYLHAADREWVMRPDPAIRFWEGDTLTLGPGMTLIRGGGHFPGGTMLHVEGAAGGRGALFAGDIIQVVADRRWVSFMYSYPNLIPLNAAEVRGVAGSVEPFAFERIYSPWEHRHVLADGKGAVRRSAERYIRHIS